MIIMGPKLKALQITEASAMPLILKSDWDGAQFMGKRSSSYCKV